MLISSHKIDGSNHQMKLNQYIPQYSDIEPPRPRSHNVERCTSTKIKNTPMVLRQDRDPYPASEDMGRSGLFEQTLLRPD